MRKGYNYFGLEFQLCHTEDLQLINSLSMQIIVESPRSN